MKILTIYIIYSSVCLYQSVEHTVYVNNQQDNKNMKETHKCDSGIR